MSVQIFVDEVRRSDYLLCAAVVAADDVSASRRVMRDLKPSNRRRLHMHSEGAASRRRILAEFARRTPIREAHIWSAPILGRPERLVRDSCFRALVPGVVDLGASRIVVESCSQDAQDATAIASALAARRATGVVRFDIVAPVQDPMLWAADVVGWAYAAGGEYRRAVDGLVHLHRIG